MYLVFSVFTSGLNSLLVPNRTFVFFHGIYAFMQ
jgi:hypothetical protein